MKKKSPDQINRCSTVHSTPPMTLPVSIYVFPSTPCPMCKLVMRSVALLNIDRGSTGALYEGLQCHVSKSSCRMSFNQSYQFKMVSCRIYNKTNTPCHVHHIFAMLLRYVSHVQFIKFPCCHVGFKGRGPQYRRRSIIADARLPLLVSSRIDVGGIVPGGRTNYTGHRRMVPCCT